MPAPLSAPSSLRLQDTANALAERPLARAAATDPDFTGHQLVEERLEKVVEDSLLARVQFDLPIYGVQNGDDFPLLA